MSRRLLMAAVLLCPGLAAAEVLRTECAGCETLRDFGNYGAAQLYRAGKKMTVPVTLGTPQGQ